MENKEKLYIISFGNSSQYRMMYDGSKEQLEKSTRMSAIKNELIEFIKDKVPMGSHAERYATPEIHEVENRDAAKYADYIDFDSVAVEDIKKTLLRDVENMLEQKQMDSNAPYGNISTHIKS